MSEKLTISKPGYEATDSNPDHLIFSSDYNTLKYFMSGDLSITIVGDDTLKRDTWSVTHNLGYVPFFLCYVNDFVYNEGYYLTPYFNSSIGITQNAEAWADTTKIYFRLTNRSMDTCTANFYYKIFANNLGF
jgi:hypothetical protein